jgi:predicted transcriptional regulator of viral defense system
MEFRKLLQLVGNEPVFSTELLLARPVDPAYLQRQLSRWTRQGYLYQIRRGLYALAPPFQKVAPHPFVIANRMVKASYVSQQSALAYYGLIPEYTPVTTSVTTARPGQWETPLGHFHFNHIKVDLFFGYRLVNVGQQQYAFIALPEKALLDLLYLMPGANDASYLAELRLQNLERLQLETLHQVAHQSGSAKLRRATDLIAELAQHEAEEYEILA